MKKKRNWLLPSLLVLAIGAFIIYRMVASGKEPVKIDTVELTEGPLKKTILVSGQVKSQAARSVYAKEMSLPIGEVLVKQGDAVSQGDVLARLDPSSLDSQVKQAKLNVKNAELSLAAEKTTNQEGLDRAKQNLEVAKLDRDSQKEAYEDAQQQKEDKKINQAALDQAKLLYDKAKLAYEGAQAEVDSFEAKSTELAENNLKLQKEVLAELEGKQTDVDIPAPIDGIISQVHAQVGAPVQGPLFEMADAKKLMVVANVGEFDVPSLAIGQDVEIKADSLGDLTLVGKISKVNSVANPSPEGLENATVEYRTEVEPTGQTDALKVGMNVRLSILLDEKKKALHVPLDAVYEEAGKSYVNLITTKDGKDQRQKVAVSKGLETDMKVEISAPELKVGQRLEKAPNQARGK